MSLGSVALVQCMCWRRLRVVAGHQAGNLEEAERLYRSIQFNLYPASNINREIINVFRIQE